HSCYYRYVFAVLVVREEQCQSHCVYPWHAHGPRLCWHSATELDIWAHCSFCGAGGCAACGAGHQRCCLVLCPQTHCTVPGALGSVGGAADIFSHCECRHETVCATQSAAARTAGV